MLRHRYLIPLILGLVLVGLAIAGFANRGTVTLAHGNRSLDVGSAPMEFQDVPLRADRHYRLAFGSVRGIPLDASATISAAMMGENDVPVFELDDSYWHMTGTWYEDGESGTWDESNAVTVFDFRVPEDGNYDFDIAVEQSTLGPIIVGAQVLQSDPLPYAEWPLLLGGVLLLFVAGWVAYNRGNVLATWVQNLGTGSKLRILGDPWEVTKWAEYDDGEYRSIELTLQSPTGDVRWLVSTRVETTYEDSEGDDHTSYYKQIWLSQEVPAEDVRSGHGFAEVGTRRYREDFENSGTESYTEYRSLAVARANYYSTMFHEGEFPKRAPGAWLERSRDRATNEEEWTQHTILHWKDIDVLEEKPQIIPEGASA